MGNNPDEMVAASLVALTDIDLRAASLKTGVQICHHFSPYAFDLSGSDDVAAGVLEGVSAALKQLDLDLQIDQLGEAFGLECWEDAPPNLEWVMTRIPQMCALGRASGAHYDGWSWEPPGEQPVTASANFRVVRAS